MGGDLGRESGTGVGRENGTGERDGKMSREKCILREKYMLCIWAGRLGRGIGPGEWAGRMGRGGGTGQPPGKHAEGPAAKAGVRGGEVGRGQRRGGSRRGWDGRVVVGGGSTDAGEGAPDAQDGQPVALRHGALHEQHRASAVAHLQRERRAKLMRKWCGDRTETRRNPGETQAKTVIETGGSGALQQWSALA